MNRPSRPRLAARWATWTARLGSRPALLIAALILVLMGRLVITVLDGSQVMSDGRTNIEQAYDLAVTGRFIEDDGELSMYREPLPAAVYAFQIRVDPRLQDVDREDLVLGGPALQTLKEQHAVWGALLLAGIALQAWRLGGRRRLGVALSAVTLVHVTFIEWVANFTLTELHATALLVWAGVFGHQWVRERRHRDAVLLGIMLGLATLVKAAVLYLGPIYLLVLAVLVLTRSRSDARRVFAAVGLALVALAVVVMPWMARNAVAFDTWSVSDRGGLMLWMRALYSEATPEEHRGMWYVFAPDPLKSQVGRVVGIDEEDVLGPLRRINHLHPDDRDDPRSFYRLARADRVTGMEAYFEAGVPTRAKSRLLADRDLMRNGLQVLRSDPIAFLDQVPVFLWRGLWPIRLVPLVPVPVLGLLNPLGIVALLTAGIAAVVRRRPAMFAVVGIPVGFVAFSALVTVYEPRSSEVAVPTMLVLLVIAAARAIDRRGPGRPTTNAAP